MATGSNVSPKPHRKILNDRRVEFIESIDVLKTPILDQLVQDKVLTQQQLASMKDKVNTNVGLASALVDHLHTRPYDDWLKFLSCLEQHGHEYLAAKLRNGSNQEQNAQPDAPDAQVRNTIALKMIDQFGIDIWPESPQQAPMEVLYTDLVLTKRDSPEDLAQVTEYTEIFKTARVFHFGKNTFIYGKIGTGKTTLVKKIAVEWAKLIHPDHCRTYETKLSDDSINWIKKLKYVILLDLSKIKKRQDLAGAIQEQLQIEKDTTTALVDYVKGSQEKTLLILDGLNSYNEATSKCFTEIVHRKQMSELTLLITSRYPRTFHSDSNVQPPESEFILLGFSDDGIKEFTHKYLPYIDSGSEKERVLNEIMKSKYLKELAGYPALLCRMVSLMKKPDECPENIKETYLELILYFCGRSRHELRDRDDKKRKKILISLGSIAVASVEEDGMKKEFSYREVMKIIDEETWELGFLFRNQCTEDTGTVSFIDSSIQQFFIAYYMANTNKQAQTEKLIKFCRAAEFLRRHELILEFVSDMGDRELRNYMTKIISNDDIKRVESQLRIRELNLD